MVPQGTPDESQNPSKIALLGIGDPPAAANWSQGCSGGGKPSKISPEQMGPAAVGVALKFAALRRRAGRDEISDHLPQPA